MEGNLDEEIGPTLFADISKRQGRARLRAMLRRALPGPWRWNDCDGHMVATSAPKFWPEGSEDGQAKWPVYVIYVDAPHTVRESYRDLMRWWPAERRDRMDEYSVATAKLIPAAVNSLGPLLDALDAAERHVARLTAPVTPEEVREFRMVAITNAESDGDPDEIALTAFLERRMKE